MQSTLALFVARICTDHTNHTLAADDFAIAANFLDRSRNFHVISPKTRSNQSLGSKHTMCPSQIVRCQLNGDLITGQNANVMYPHLT
jgi:hypothetical protein